MPREIAERSDVVPVLGEIFRESGYAGASLSEITRRTGLGKSSLYHFFPGGKKEMARVVLGDISNWFEENVYAPLRDRTSLNKSIKVMFDAVDRYFCSGNRICLVGAFALDATRDEFAEDVNDYFTAWTDALVKALKQGGYPLREARDMAEDIVSGIQGALVLARSHDDPKVFSRALKRLRQRVCFNG